MKYLRLMDTKIKGKGIDIGFGGCLLSKNCRGWDIEDGDAQFMRGVEDAKYG